MQGEQPAAAPPQILLDAADLDDDAMTTHLFKLARARKS